MRNFVKNVLLFSMSICVTLILSEVIIRIVAPQRVFAGRIQFEPDEHLVFKLAPDFSIVYSLGEFQVTEATNSLGLRDHEIGPKKPGGYRFLGLGDSFSFASGVELKETYFKVLEGILPNSWKRPVEVINCAVPGYSLLQEIRFLKKYGVGFQPDAVIIGYYCGNDFTDSYDLYDTEGRPMMVVQDGQLVTRGIGEDPNKIRYATAWIRGFLGSHSHMYCFLRDRLSDVLVKLGVRKPPEPPDFCAKRFNEHTQNGWRLNQRLLQEAAEFARSNKLRLIVAILPTIYQVYENIWDNEVKRLNIDSNLYDFEKPDSIVSAACTQNGIECVDMLPALRRSSAGRNLYYRIDAHMTPEGHRIVADSLARYFTDFPKKIAERSE